MMVLPPPKTKRTIGKTALRVLFPFAAIRHTAALAKQEAQRTLDNLGLLKDLSRQARQVMQHGISEANRKNESFQAAMSRRGADAASLAGLRWRFLIKKRCAIAAALLFAVISGIGMASGLHHGSGRSVVLGLLCLLASQPLLFVMALGAQLRIWQLDTGRLSKEERASLQDFQREHPCWWCATLNPELTFKQGRAP
jgi:hypothetical protein